MSSMDRDIVVSLGLNGDAYVPGSLEMRFEDNQPHLTMKMDFIVPPHLMAQAFQAVTPPQEQAAPPPPPPPPPADPDPVPSPSPFPTAPDAGTPGTEEAAQAEDETVHDITSLEPVP